MPPTVRPAAAPAAIATRASAVVFTIALTFGSLVLPQPVRASERTVAALLAEQRWPEALTAIDRQLKRSPNDTALLMDRGAVLSAMGRDDEALAAFRRVATLQPQLAAAHNNMAVILAAMGRHGEARAALERAIRIQPGYATAHENLGDLHAHLAGESYRQALQANPGLASAKTKLDTANTLIALATGAGTPQRAGPPIARPAVAGAVAAPGSAAAGAGAPATAASLRQAATPASAAAAARPAPGGTAPGADRAPAAPATPAPAASAARAGTALATPGNPRAEVEAAVRAWAQAWSDRDVEAYVGAYAPDFKGGAADPQAWRRDRSARIAATSRIEVRLTELRVRVDGDRAQATFVQSFDSSIPRSRARTGKTLELQRIQGRWLIREEIRR